MSRLFRSVEGGELFPNGSVVCIGAFDGLHLGHRALVRHAVARARALGVAAVAVAFEPLPREFFAQGTPPPRLTLARSKVEMLQDLVLVAVNEALRGVTEQGEERLASVTGGLSIPGLF